MAVSAARVPAQFEPLFERAEVRVRGFFDNIERSPSTGEIRVGGDRYLFVRGASLINALIDRMESQFGVDVMREFLFDLAKAIGRSDAKDFAQKLDLKDPASRLSAGPVHFAYTGWAFVDILPQSAPAPDESFLLCYDHPNTFESNHYRALGRRLDRPTCHFSAGYSSGWCSDAFGLELEAREVSCVACGDDRCRFVMAPHSHLDAHCRRLASVR